jgi:hypothetical protein
MPIIPALERLRQEDLKLEACESFSKKNKKENRKY